jgi:pseudaminic acid biosynthesis-associated methylase
LTNTTELWAGSFGTAYHERNRVQWEARIPFWESAIQYTNAMRLFELGCGPGWNFRAIQACAPGAECFGADLNQEAVNEARAAGFEVHPCHEQGIVGLYEPGTMDMVYTAGCLIHIPPETLERTMRQLVDLSGRYVLAVEYHLEEGEEEVEYRGHAGALWKRNYGKLYQDLGLRLLSQGEAGGFDQCTYYLLEKPV